MHRYYLSARFQSRLYRDCEVQALLTSIFLSRFCTPALFQMTPPMSSLAHVNSCISGRHSCTKRGSFPFDLQFAKAIAIRRSADCRTSIKRLELEALKCT